jgi:hypothetical protein
MTPTDEARFIALWQQGLDTAAIARQLGIPRGTVFSRANRLQQQGKIQPRPRVGVRMPARQPSARAPRVSADTHQRTPRVSRRVSADTPPVQYLPPGQGELSPLLQDILQELRHLTGALAARVSTDTPGVHHDTREVSSGVSARTPLPAERGKSVRWNLHLSERLREQVKALAAARGLQDSQMVEELLWLALAMVEEER